MASRNWQRDELILAFNLYCKTPFGRIDNQNPDIIALADTIGRSPSAVSWKLANFARLDPSLQKRGISGAVHGSKSDIDIWNEFNSDWEKLAFESERLLAQVTGESIEKAIGVVNDDQLPREGQERERFIRARVNQGFFRTVVLAAYDNRCCITGLPITELLIASHIVPWSYDSKNRLNPRNGLCLNAIHDRAFDRGLLTITPDFTVKLSSSLKNLSRSNAVTDLLIRYDGVNINLPRRFIPDQSFLEYHNGAIFRG